MHGLGTEDHVARYGEQHKHETRRRILETAGHRFKQDGIDGSGISTLMTDAGLTNGAFYVHFASKIDLVAAAIADQLRSQLDSMASLAPGRAGVEQLVHTYLSAEHRDNPGYGCPSAALLDEVGRCAAPVKQAYNDGIGGIVADIARRSAPHDPDSARVATLGLVALLVGTLQMSRAMMDERLSDAVLDNGVRTALALIDGVAST